MPLLQRIRSALDWTFASQEHHKTDARRLRALIDRYDAGGYPDSLPITKAMATLGAEMPLNFENIGSKFWDAWKVVAEDLPWFADMFFRPQATSMLYTLLANTPARIGECFLAGLAQADLDAGDTEFRSTTKFSFSEDAHVYCPTQLQTQLIKDVFSNMVKYREPINLSTINYFLSDVEEGNRIKLTIANDGTARRKEEGFRPHSLTLLQSQLEKFDGKLTREDHPLVIGHSGATFQVTIDLLLWKGLRK